MKTMQLITFKYSDSENGIIEFNLNNEDVFYYLTNVAEHISKIYKFRKPPKGSEKDRFIIKYGGNIMSKADDRDVAYFIILKEKEASEYLIEVNIFNTMFRLI